MRPRGWLLLSAVCVGGNLLSATAQECTDLPTIPNMFHAQLKPVLGPCSGNGDCVKNRCECYDGFTGRADFLNTEGEDCQLSYNAIRGLWAANLLICLINFGRAFPGMRLRWEQYSEIRARRQAMGESHPLKKNRGLAALLLAAFVMYPAMIAMAILMLARPETERVGITPAATIFFALARISFYTSIYLFQPALIASLLKSSRATRYLIHQTYLTSAILSGMGVITGILPFFTLGLSDDGKGAVARGIYLATMGGTLVQISSLGIQSLWTKIKVQRALDASYELTRSPRTLELKAALLAVERENMVQTGVQALFYIVLTFVPFVANFHNYWLPVGWFAYSVLGYKVANTTIDNKDGSKTDTSSSLAIGDSTGGQSFSGHHGRFHDTDADSTAVKRFEKQVGSFVEHHSDHESEEYV